MSNLHNEAVRERLLDKITSMTVDQFQNACENRLQMTFCPETWISQWSPTKDQARDAQRRKKQFENSHSEGTARASFGIVLEHDGKAISEVMVERPLLGYYHRARGEALLSSRQCPPQKRHSARPTAEVQTVPCVCGLQTA